MAKERRDTGIYVRISEPLKRIDHGRSVPNGHQQIMDAVLSAVVADDDAHDIDGIVARCSERAKEILARMRSGEWNPAWGDRQECISDAITMDDELIRLRVALTSNDVRAAAAAAYWLGRADERRSVRPAEPAAFRGKEVLTGAIDGGKRRALPAEEIERRTREWQTAVEDLMRGNPYVSYTEATERVAKKFGIKSGRTVRNYCHNPKK